MEIWAQPDWPAKDQARGLMRVRVESCSTLRYKTTMELFKRVGLLRSAHFLC